MPPSFGLLWFGLLKGIAGLAGIFLVASLGPALWADPPGALRPRGVPRESADVVMLFRSTEAIDFERRVVAAQTALLERFPPGSESSALLAFLTDTGRGRCQPTAPENGRRGHYCLVQYGSLAASVLGLNRWRLREWVVGVGLAPGTEAIESIGVRVPFLGKG